MNAHHHGCGHHHCGCCCGSRAYCPACSDEAAWALGELVLAPFVALGIVAAWLARRPVALVIVLGAAVVALAVTQAVMGL
jgi:hypothetical protein